MTVSELAEALSKLPPDSPVGQWRYVGTKFRFQEIESLSVEVFNCRAMTGVRFGQYTEAVSQKEFVDKAILNG